MLAAVALPALTLCPAWLGAFAAPRRVRASSCRLRAVSEGPSQRRLAAVPAAPERVRDRARADDDAADRALVVRAHAGDRAALGELLGKYGPILYRAVLLPRLGQPALAEDALSQTYVRVVERFDAFTWQDRGVFPWLRTVALHVALDLVRSRKRTVLWDEETLAREVDEAEAEAPIDVAVAEQRDLARARARVDAALDRLNPRYARAIRLRILDERPRDEVARLLEVTPATFDVLLHRAVAALKKALEASPEGNRDG